MSQRDEAASILLHAMGRIVEELPRLAEMAKQEERAAVVAWLRERHADTREHDGFEDAYDNAVSCTYRRAADAIESGEHRREEAVCAHGNTECQRCGVGPGCGEHRREEE